MTAMTRRDPVGVLLVDDHPAMREAVRRRLKPRFEIVREAGDFTEAIAEIEAICPHVAVIDIRLGKGCGLRLARRVVKRYPATRVLIWSNWDTADYVAEAKAIGARGYVLKSAPTEEIVRAIEVVAAGACYYSAGVDRAPGQRPALTSRELDILALVTKGRTSPEIAAQLGIERRTVEGHRLNIMDKLGARNPADLTRIAIRTGLVDVDEDEGEDEDEDEDTEGTGGE